MEPDLSPKSSSLRTLFVRPKKSSILDLIHSKFILLQFSTICRISSLLMTTILLSSGNVLVDSNGDSTTK